MPTQTQTTQPEIIINYDDSKWLMISSLLFLPSAFLSYKREYYTQCYGMLFTVFSSVNFWRKATYGNRRMIDLACSKISGCIFTINGFVYLKGYGKISWLNWLFAIYCYYNSNKLYESNNNKWLKWHMLFHMCAGIQACIITYYLP
jgi:hypothetical protein